MSSFDMRDSLLMLLCVAIGFGALSTVRAQIAPARQPFGIYARFVPDVCISEYPRLGSNTDECISNSIADILSNTAISGIAAFVQWDQISQTVGATNSVMWTNDWSVLDDIFGAVELWNGQNSNAPPRTIQLGLIPGFDTPQWVLNSVSNCDPMFLTNGVVDTNAVPTNCGCATFLSGEGPKVVYTNKLLPLPWNPFYTNAYAAFVQAAAQRYGTNPLLVSVAVAGPTSDSTEMILPNEKNNPTNYWKWNALFSLTFPSNYQNSDQAFIEAWERAIDVYGQAFSNVTLAVITGSGLPNFTNSDGKPYANYTIPPGFQWPPGPVNPKDLADIMDAAAETMVLAYFVDPRHGGNNAKAVQENGMTAMEITRTNILGDGDLNSYAMKWLAASSASGSAPLPGTTNVISRVFGGLQFDTSFSLDPQYEGCNMSDGCMNAGDPIISPEQAFYNALQVYFDGTSVGASYGTNDSSGALPLNYVQIYSDDIIYANTNTMGTNIVDGFGNTINNMTAQIEFHNASNQIFQIAEAVLYINAASNTLQVLWPEAAAPYQLQVNDDLAKNDGWKTNANTSAPTITNGFYQVTIDSSPAARFYRLALP
jgi:hypothetical protein